MLDLIATIALAAHLLAVNVASAGPLVCVWLHWRWKHRDDEAAGVVGRRLAAGSFWSLLIGMILGGAALAAMWAGSETSYFNALGQFPAKKYWYALAELICSLVWTGGYWALWNRARRRPLLLGTLALFSATNLLYHFPPLLGAIAAASIHPDKAATLSTTTTIAWLRDPEIGSRVVHVWLASFAVTGVALMGYALGLARRDSLAREAPRIAAYGARLALIVSLAQLVVGVWVLMVLPERSQSGVMGGDLLATGLLLASIALSLALMHALAAVALKDCSRSVIVRSMVLTALVVLLMSATLRRTRQLDSPRTGRSSAGHPTMWLGTV